MKDQKMSKCLSSLSKLASSTLPQTSITQTLPNVPYAHGRIIFLSEWKACQNLSPLPSGVAPQCNAMLHSTCYAHVVKILSSWHTKHLRGHSLSTPYPWHPKEQRFLCTWNQSVDVCGAVMHPRRGTYCMLQIPIVAFESSWLTQVARGSPTRSDSSIMPSQSQK
jgi:hypothetical protein